MEAGPYILSMRIEQGEGVGSSEELLSIACTGVTKEFISRAVRIADVEFLGIDESSNGYSYDSLTNGAGKNIGLFRITADDRQNTDVDGDDLNILVSTLKLKINDGE